MEKSVLLPKRRMTARKQRQHMSTTVGKNICAFVSQKVNCKMKSYVSFQMYILYTSKIKLLKRIKQDANFDMVLENKNAYYDRYTIQKLLNLSDEEYEVVILNLFRLGICESLKSTGNIISVDNLQVRADAGIDKIRITRLGYNLIKNCEE